MEKEARLTTLLAVRTLWMEGLQDVGRGLEIGDGQERPQRLATASNYLVMATTGSQVPNAGAKKTAVLKLGLLMVRISG